MLSKEEIKSRREALEKRFSPWKRQTIGDWFDDRVAEFSERELIFTLQRSYGYKETQEIVNNLAKGFLKLGVKRREHVAYIMANYPELLFLRFALAKIGAVAVGINIRSGLEELRYFLRQSDISHVVTMDRFARLDYVDMLKKLCPELQEAKVRGQIKAEAFPLLRNVITFSPAGEIYPETIDFYSLVKEGQEVPDEKLAQAQAASRYPDEVCDILYTSATTGRPRAALLWHDGFLRTGYGHAYGRPNQDGRRIFVPLPLNHVFAYAEAMVAGMDVGGSLILQSAFALPEAYELIEKGRAYDMVCVPTIMIALLSHPDREKYDLSSLKGVVMAAAPAPVPLWERVIKELGLIELTTGYGQTETHGGTCVAAPEATIDTLAHRIGHVKPGGAAALPEFHGSFCEYKVIDSITGKDLSQGAEGELACRGATITRGYYNSPEENARTFDKDGWMRTGDLGIIHNDGYIELTGRSKELYIVAGELVAPREVENYISRYPKVNQVYITGVPDAKLGEVGVAYIELKSGETCSRGEIISFCKGELARYKLPTYVKFISGSEFPLTATGKVQKFKLRERAVKELGLEEVSARYEVTRKVG
jgi:fatty-acyl-CoA synthase